MTSDFVSIIAVSDDASALKKFSERACPDKMDLGRNRRGRPGLPTISFQGLLPVVSASRDESSAEQTRAWGCPEPEGDETWGPHDFSLAGHGGLKWDLLCEGAPDKLFRKASESHPDIAFVVARTRHNSPAADIAVFHAGEKAYFGSLTAEAKRALSSVEANDDIEERAITAVLAQAEEAISLALTPEVSAPSP